MQKSTAKDAKSAKEIQNTKNWNRRWTQINAVSSAFIGGFKFHVFLGDLGVLGGSVFFVVSVVPSWFNSSSPFHGGSGKGFFSVPPDLLWSGFAA